MLDGEDAATSQFRDFTEQRRPVELLRRSTTISKRVKNADGIKLSIRFSDQALDIVLVVPTMIITSIGKDEQGTFGVVCTPHLAEAQVDGIQKRSPAPGGSEHHAALQILHAVGERTGELGALIEAHQKEFILWIGGLEEFHGGIAGFANLVGHAAAKIKDDSDGDRDVLRR